VAFAEYRLFHRAPLQKRPIILRSLPIVATTYNFKGPTNCSHPIDWFGLPIFRTDLVRFFRTHLVGSRISRWNFKNKRAVPVQIAPLLISQPRNQNKSFTTVLCASRTSDKQKQTKTNQKSGAAIPSSSDSRKAVCVCVCACECESHRGQTSQRKAAPPLYGHSLILSVA